MNGQILHFPTRTEDSNINTGTEGTSSVGDRGAAEQETVSTQSDGFADRETFSTGSTILFDKENYDFSDTDLEAEGTGIWMQGWLDATKPSEDVAVTNSEEPMANEQSGKNYFDDFLKAKFEHIDFIFGQIRDDVQSIKSENKQTRNTVIITGLSVVLSLGAIIMGMIYATAQINTAWLTSLAQIFKNQ